MDARLRTLQWYTALLEVNRTAVTESGLSEIFSGVCTAVRTVMPFDRAGLSLYTPEMDALKLVAHDGCGPDSFYRIGVRFDCKESHHGWVFEHRRPIVRRDLEREVEFQVEQHNITEGIRSYCAVPMIVRKESIGVIIMLSSQKNRYSERHAEFLQQVSDQVVLAVRSLMPFCIKHLRTRMLCPRCIASGGGQATAARYKEQLSGWGKQGGRGRKKPPGGLTGGVLE